MKHTVNLLLEVFVTDYQHRHFDTVSHLTRLSNPRWMDCMNCTAGNDDVELDLGADTFFKLLGNKD